MMLIKLIVILFAISIAIPTSMAFAAQTVNDRIEIDNDDIAAAINAGDLFGYQIESIGDLDSNGVTDLATIKFSDDSNEANVGSVLILFMNGDGSVSSTNEIIMDNSAGNLSGCLAAGSTNRDNGSLEQLAFVGDLDGDGEPTIALGANSNDHDTGAGVVVDTGAVYMLELNSDGTVDNCVLITEDSNGFTPADGVYQQDAAANFGWPVIATDLNGDGQNELLVGANSESNLQTDLWPLFLTTTGTVSSHPATPVSGLTIGIDTNEFIDDGASISGTKIVVSNQNDGDGGGSVFIVNLSSAGAFVSSTEIAGSSIGGIANDERFGSGVTPLGDMDNDGINDILVGNEAGDDTNSLSGEVHILFLNADDSLKESQKISNESENTRTGSAPFAASDLFGHGMALWIDSGDNAVIAISAHQDDTGAEANSGAIHLLYITRSTSTTTTTTTNSGDSDGEHNSKPTFGLDHKTNVQRVDGGLVLNDVAFTVDDNFYTAVPMQYFNIGEIQNFTAKVYASDGLRLMEFFFGIPEVGKWHEAEASVTFEFNHFTGELQKVYAKNIDDIIVNATSIIYSTEKVQCKSDDSQKLCDQISMELSFNEAPIGKVLAMQAIDGKRRSNIVYFNDGITMEGKSQNPSTTQQIISEIKYKGLQNIQRIDKVNDIWMTLDEAEPVLTYKQNEFGSFTPVQYKIQESIPDEPGMNIGKYHSEFKNLVKYEQKRATAQFDSQDIQSVLNPSWNYEYPLEVDRLEKIKHVLESEKIRSLVILENTYTANEKPKHQHD